MPFYDILRRRWDDLDRSQFAFSLEKWEKLIVIFIICLGAALRLAMLGVLPEGLNQDEASAGYEAWSILNYGIDRHGYSLPVLLRAWGSGQNVLFSYLSMPFIAMFGLSAFSLRLTSALFGIMTLYVFWLLAREARGRGFALTALLVLAVNPWHIMISRWALESNLLPFFLLLGIYLMVLSLRRPAAILPSAAAFALSLYAYGTAFIFLSLFLIFGVFWLIRHDGFKPKYFLPALALFVIIALPITICQINNVTGYRDLTLLGLSLPKLTESRQAATTIFGGGVTSPVQNFETFFSIITKQSDGLPFNSMPPFYGIYYFWGLPFVVAGLISSVASFRDRRSEVPMLVALIVSVLCSFFIVPNINRMNMAWLPLIYFEAVGMYMLMRRMKKYFIVPVFSLLVSVAFFISSYVGAFQSSPYYFPGLRQAFEYVEKLEPESVFVSNYVNQPYIFALFYNEISPYDFISTVHYVNRGAAFEVVSEFGKYRFGEAEDAKSEYLILHNAQCTGFEVLETFGHYSVCAGEK